MSPDINPNRGIVAIFRRLGKVFARPIHIGEPRMVSANEVYWTVDGKNVWFRTHDTELLPRSEAIATALFVPAARAGRQLVLTQVDHEWLENSKNALQCLNKWWGYETKPPVASGYYSPLSEVDGRGCGLLFSLGVDSFYSLFSGAYKHDFLIHILRGKDETTPAIKPGLRRSLEAVAQYTGTRLVQIETNVDEHPLFNRERWVRSHGGAYVGASHLLSAYIQKLYVSASHVPANLHPWGSGPDIDPCWSSSRLGVEHVGMDAWRHQKLEALLKNPESREIVRHHLRVCARADTATGNCGKCSKCVRTRIAARRFAPGVSLPTIPDTISLVDGVKRIKFLAGNGAIGAWKMLIGVDDPQLDKAIRELVDRSIRT